MQPLSLTTSLYPRGLTTGLSGSSLLASPQTDLTRPAAGTVGQTGGQSSMAAMLPMIMQVLQMVMQLMQTMIGGSPSKAGTTGNTAGTGNAGGAGGYGGGAPTDSTGSNPGTVPGPGVPGAGVFPGGSADAQTIDQRRNFNYSNLSATEKEQFNGVSRESAAILHLGGRAHISDDATASGVSSSARIYNTVLGSPSNFSPQEVALVQQWAADEKAKYGFFTGENLDHAFIEEMGARNGTDISKMQQYHAAVDQRVGNVLNNPNRDQVVADSNLQLELTSDLDVLQQRSGLTHAEQAVYRLAGHSVLFSGNGQVDGDILPITLGNTNSLDGRAFGTQNTNIDKETQDIMDADLADNGQVDGSALRAANNQVLDKIFLGGGGIQTSQQIKDQGVQTGISSGRTMQDIQRSIVEGGQQALQDFKNLATNHTPGMLAGAATMAGAAAICPFLGGMAAGAMGIGAGQKAMQ